MRHLSIMGFRRLFLLLLLFYSCFHFFQTGMGGINTKPEMRCGGDFTGGFPSGFVKSYNPSLVAAMPPSIGMREPEGISWGYGPMFPFITLPLTLLRNKGEVCCVWQAMNFFFIVIAAYFLFRVVFKNTETTFGLVVLYISMWGNFYPLLDGMGGPAIEIFEFLLVVIAFTYLLNRKPIGANKESMAGIFVGLAAMTKFLPAIFLPYFFIRKKWKALFWGILTVAVIAILTEYLLGWSENGTFELVAVEYRIDFHTQSLSGMVGRFFAIFPLGLSRTGSTAIIPPGIKDFADFTVICFELIAMALFSILFFVRRNSPRNSLMTHIEVSLLVAFMIFIPQWNEPYYQIFLLLPLTVMLKFIWEGNKKNIFLWSLFGILYLSTMSIIVPASLVNGSLNLGHYGIYQALGNLSTPAFSNLGIIIFFAILYLKPAIVSTNVPNPEEKAG